MADQPVDPTRELALKDLSQATFRANPAYELVPMERLPERAEVWPGQRPEGTDLFGLLWARQPGALPPKAVRQETASLLLALQKPGRLPEHVRSTLGPECGRVIAVLVLDAILELEDRGGFVTGAAAYERLWQTQPTFLPRGTVAALSLEALKYAHAMALEAPSRVYQALYRYNRLPASPAWVRRLRAPEDVADFLGIGRSPRVDRGLQEYQLVNPQASPNRGWLAWNLRSSGAQLDVSQRIYKLYVSPRCEDMPEAFEACLLAFPEAGVPSFKVGHDLYGLLRPDKVVAYFPTFEAMRDTAERLSVHLVGCPVHGVPFTAELAGEGLLSWGIDPPDDEGALSTGRESWRSWLTRCMATAVLEARAAGFEWTEPWQYVLGRLELQGIDTDSWTPTPHLWN